MFPVNRLTIFDVLRESSSRRHAIFDVIVILADENLPRNFTTALLLLTRTPLATSENKVDDLNDLLRAVS